VVDGRRESDGGRGTVEEVPVNGHYYAIVVEGAKTHRSVFGRYRGKVRLRGVVHWWFTGDAFQVLIDPDDIVEWKDLGRLYGRTV
jgi:hypothetical protein